MAPGSDAPREIRNTGARRQAENRGPAGCAGSVLLFLDVLDHLGHVVLVLAEFRGVLEKLLVLLFGFLERHRLFLVRRIGLLGFGVGIELVGADRLELLLDWRGGARATRFQKGLRVKGSAAFRADHRLAQQIVIARSATRTNPLGAPFGFGHHSLHKKFGRFRRRAIATGASPCQKQTCESKSTEGCAGGLQHMGRRRCGRNLVAGFRGLLFAMAQSISSRSPSPRTVARPGNPLAGKIRVPGDKSVSHRALMLGALAIGRTDIAGLLDGEDVLATAAALNALGAGIVRAEDGRWLVDGVGLGGLAEPDDVIDLGNSGTGARLLLGILASHPFTAFVTGDAS